MVSIEMLVFDIWKGSNECKFMSIKNEQETTKKAPYLQEELGIYLIFDTFQSAFHVNESFGTNDQTSF